MKCWDIFLSCIQVNKRDPTLQSTAHHYNPSYLFIVSHFSCNPWQWIIDLVAWCWKIDAMTHLLHLPNGLTIAIHAIRIRWKEIYSERQQKRILSMKSRVEFDKWMERVERCSFESQFDKTIDIIEKYFSRVNVPSHTWFGRTKEFSVEQNRAPKFGYL